MMKQLKMENIGKRYSPQEKMPLAGYAIATVVFNALLFSLIRSSRRTGKRKAPDIPEMIIAGMAMHKLSRIVTKDAVTSFLRAPFTRYQEPLGYGELKEEPRLRGNLEVVAEMLNCSYCMSAWSGLAVYWGLLRFPDSARILNRFFSSLAISDFLHVLYEEHRTRSNVLTLKEDERERRRQAG